MVEQAIGRTAGLVVVHPETCYTPFEFCRSRPVAEVRGRFLSRSSA